MKNLMAIIVLLGIAGLTMITCDCNDCSTTDLIDEMKTAFESKGFLAQEGEMFFFRLEDKWEMPTYYGNNPASPYGFFRLPPGPGEPDTDDVKVLPWDGELDNYAKRSLFRLRPDEAVVLIGQTPPECTYFGFTGYLFFRYLTEGGEVQLNDFFASLGDTENNLTLNTSSDYEDPTLDPFDKLTVLISAADRETERKAREALIDCGIPENIINTGVIPHLDNEEHDFAPLLNMGYEEHSDIFSLLMRVAGFSDQTAGDKFVETPPYNIFRLTPREQGSADPFTLPDLREEGTGTSETPLTTSFLNLVQAVRNEYQNQDRIMVTKQGQALPVEGPDCIRNGQFCFGDNHDAQYILYPIKKLINTFTGFELSFDEDDFLIVVGVISSLTGKATYVNITPYELDRKLGLLSMMGEAALGSADRFIPEDPNRDLFYVVKIARSCESNGEIDPYCIEIPTCSDDDPDLFPCAPLEGDLFIMNRVYLEPVTNCQPYEGEILMPYFVRVTPRN